MKSSNINGVINVYKEKGFTSHDVVAKLRGILKIKKIGHTGTLDPNAEGVLPVCIGNATKLCDMIMEKVKVYEAELILGRTTDTQDLTGTTIDTMDIDEIKERIADVDLKNVIQSFVGKYNQIPPMYSALKVNGRKLYDLAREGIEIERKAREVEIHSIEILNDEMPVIKIRVSCSKGTYIRTLCYDIGNKIGIPSCMGELLRVLSGMFLLEDSYKLNKIEETVRNNLLDESGMITDTEDILSNYDKLIVKDEFDKLLMNGNKLVKVMFTNESISSITEINEGAWYRVYNSKNEFVGVYEYQNEIFQPEKMFL